MGFLSSRRPGKGDADDDYRTAPYVVVPASPILGAEIVGVDLANGVDEATADALREDF